MTTENQSIITKVEFIDKFLGLSFKIGLLLGGAILIFYCKEIGYFPADITIGDGLSFIMLAMGFGIVYLFFVTCFTSLGLCLRPEFTIIQQLFLFIANKFNKESSNSSQLEVIKIREANWSNFVFALFGVYMIYRFTLINTENLIPLGLCTFISACLWSICLDNEDNIRILTKQRQLTTQKKTDLALKIKNRYIMLIFFVIMPGLISGIFSDMLDATMRFVKIRNDNVTVHIKEPYTINLSEINLKGSKSSFGENYKKYEHVNILFSGIGKNTVLSIKNAQNENFTSISIPSDFLQIIPANK